MTYQLKCTNRFHNAHGVDGRRKILCILSQPLPCLMLNFPFHLGLILKNFFIATDHAVPKLSSTYIGRSNTINFDNSTDSVVNFGKILITLVLFLCLSNRAVNPNRNGQNLSVFGNFYSLLSIWQHFEHFLATINLLWKILNYFSP